jgi:hypothetical protein
MPSSRYTKACAPASTTPAFASTFICRGVLASALCASVSDSGRRSAKSSTSSARFETCRDQSRMTERIVPSTGRAIALQADSPARTTAAPKSRVVTRGLSGRPSENPQKNCARIAPELPRAPPTASSARAFDISRTWRWRLREIPAAIFWSVEATLVPVSPSGTGKTLILFRASARSPTNRAPAITARERRRPSRYAIEIKA